MTPASNIVPPGSVRLCTLEFPLPLDVAGALMLAVCETAEAHGYTEVSMTGDMATVVAKPPPGRLR